MNPDDIAVRPVITGNAVRPVHRESPSRDSTGGQHPHTHQPAEAESEEGSTPVTTEEIHLIDLRA